jgi:predicted nucleic acid-binding protein
VVHVTHMPKMIQIRHVPNALHQLLRARRGPEVAAALELLTGFPGTRYPHEPILGRIWTLRVNLTAYDAVYAALAEALGATLLKLDERLAAAPGTRATIVLL